MLFIIFRFLSFLAIKLIFPIEVYGLENIPKTGGFILASNHASYLDPVVLGAMCPRYMHFMARHDLFGNPLSSWFLSQLNAFPVRRNSADISALKKAIRLVKKGEGLLLFPEGSRQVEGISFNPQSGIGFLAVKINAPVIPALIRGTELAMPKGSKGIRRVKISVYFGKQIPIERSMPYHDIALQIMENIRHLS
ncbi:MAG: lysophospholipid acyltransferase family protein [Candidatus Omnitrophota bacterium]